MGSQGPSLAWARRADRALKTSLRALAGYLAEHPGLNDIVAICGDMRLGSGRQEIQFARLAVRYGFERADNQWSAAESCIRLGIQSSLLCWLQPLIRMPYATRPCD